MKILFHVCQMLYMLHRDNIQQVCSKLVRHSQKVRICLYKSIDHRPHKAFHFQGQQHPHLYIGQVHQILQSIALQFFTGNVLMSDFESLS